MPNHLPLLVEHKNGGDQLGHGSWWYQDLKDAVDCN